MIAILVVLGIIAFLCAIPSPKPAPAPVTINVDRTTHVHMHVTVQNDNRVVNVALPQSAAAAIEALPRQIPTATALERYRQHQLPVKEQKLLS